jgi:hypothetical protein
MAAFAKAPPVLQKVSSHAGPEQEGRPGPVPRTLVVPSEPSWFGFLKPDRTFTFEGFLRHNVLAYGTAAWRVAHGRPVAPPDKSKLVVRFNLGTVGEGIKGLGLSFRVDAQAAVGVDGRLYYRLTEIQPRRPGTETWYYAGIAKELFERAASAYENVS